MLTTLASYRLITKDYDRTIAVTSAKQPTARESQYYLDTIGSIKSIDDFMKNTRVYNYAMKAFGLEDVSSAKAMIRKILTEGITDSKSYANRLNDSRFLALAKTFNFAADGEAATQKTDAQQGVVDRYIRQEIETSAGQDDEGVRLALYFQREAPNVKSAYGLLGDTALWTVVKTIFGFPDAMASADIDKQAAAVEKRLNLSDLQDPAKLEKLITRFAATWDATQNTTTDPILALFDTTSTSGANVDFDLAMTLTNLKHGGT